MVPMKARDVATYAWNCDVCGEVIRGEIPVEVAGTTAGQVTLTSLMQTEHLTDVFAHAWTHEES